MLKIVLQCCLGQLFGIYQLLDLIHSLPAWTFVEDFHPLRQLNDMCLRLMLAWINLIGLEIKHLTILEVSCGCSLLKLLIIEQMYQLFQVQR